MPVRKNTKVYPYTFIIAPILPGYVFAGLRSLDHGCVPWFSKLFIMIYAGLPRPAHDGPVISYGTINTYKISSSGSVEA